ncbi:MAG: DUF1549 domain-containing protein [Pirellulaceae bacterium]
MKTSRLSIVASLLVCWALPNAGIGQQTGVAIDFDLEIKPLLSDRCFVCHGPDEAERATELRLDVRDGLFAMVDGVYGQFAVKPNDPSDSELYGRITSDDESLVMPPRDSGLNLSTDEIDLIRRWIEQGAAWKGHWSFEPIVSPPVPEPTAIESLHEASQIDRFIDARLDAAGLRRNPEERPERLVRRLYYDLTGLPPTPRELQQATRNWDASSYARLVDKLLASPAFGERVASDWLDAARYSDSYGYQVDRDRRVWPWRDWVLDAINENMPYDQFLTQQLAGDLMPDADDRRILATTFNRLHPQKVEGGSVPEEFRIEYVSDRVQTFSTAVLGLTMECSLPRSQIRPPDTARLLPTERFFRQDR